MNTVFLKNTISVRVVSEVLDKRIEVEISMRPPEFEHSKQFSGYAKVSDGDRSSECATGWQSSPSDVVEGLRKQCPALEHPDCSTAVVGCLNGIFALSGSIEADRTETRSPLTKG